MRAGVTHTTAYAYFSSKAHLLTEVFRRRLKSLPEPTADPDRPLAERVAEALSGPSLLLADDPAIAQAALPASDPEVARLRTEIGAYLTDRVRLASGDDTDPAMTETILLVFSDAMLQAGMGYFDYDGVVLRVVRTAEMLTTQSCLRHPRAATE
jgi:AcrR family transcriptional regulator